MIVAALVLMYGTLDLNYQCMAVTVEIGKITGDDLRAAEVSFQIISPQFLPQNSFLGSGVCTKLPRPAGLFRADLLTANNVPRHTG